MSIRYEDLKSLPADRDAFFRSVPPGAPQKPREPIRSSPSAEQDQRQMLGDSDQPETRTPSHTLDDARNNEASPVAVAQATVTVRGVSYTF